MTKMTIKAQLAADALAQMLASGDASAADVDVDVTWIDSPVGPLLAGATRSAIVLLEFSERDILQQQLASVRRRFRASLRSGPNRWLDLLQTQLHEYFAGQRRQFELPLEYPGTAFQQRVWSTLLTIPYGVTWSYLDMARSLGDIKATRAVGTANGLNRIAIVIPCHRVINADGKLGGYGGGLWRKQRLLDLERGQGALAMDN